MIAKKMVPENSNSPKQMKAITTIAQKTSTTPRLGDYMEANHT